MKSKIKYLVIFGTAFMIIGAFIMGAGFAFGAKTSLYIDKNGIHLPPDEPYKIYADSEELGEINEININASTFDVEIIAADEFAFEICSMADNKTDWNVTGGVLNVDQNFSVSLFDFSFLRGFFEKDYIKIYVRENAELNKVRLKGSSGNVKITGIVCETIELNMLSGDFKMEKNTIRNFKADLTSGNFKMDECAIMNSDIKLLSGDVKITNMISHGLNLKCTSGNINLTGDFQGENTINAISGNINATFSGNAIDYKKSFKLTSGNLKKHINGKKVNDYDNVSDAPNTLTVKSTSGNISIDFTER